MVKNPPANAEDLRDAGLIPGSGRYPCGGHGNPLQYSCLENLMDRRGWQAIVHRVTKRQTRLKRLSMHTRKHCFFIYEKTMTKMSSYSQWFKRKMWNKMDTSIIFTVQLNPSYQVNQLFQIKFNFFSNLIRMFSALKVSEQYNSN